MVDPRPMNRFRWIAATLPTSAAHAWWDAWDDFWRWISEKFDAAFSRDLKSIERNDSIHEIDGGGNFYAAGCGSDGE